MAALQLRLVGSNQLDVELHFGERLVQAELLSLGRVFDAVGFNHQLFTGGEGEVVVGVLVTCQVDLGGQVLVARLGDEEVDVRRTVTVTTQQVQQCLGRTLGRAAVASRNDGPGSVTAIFVGLDATTQVVSVWDWSK